MNEPGLKIIDVFVCKLRKKLAQATGGKHYIETVWGRGYALRDQGGTVAETVRGGPDHSEKRFQPSYQPAHGLTTHPAG
jgi:two-component system cell cycle response regulator CtrA